MKNATISINKPLIMTRPPKGLAPTRSEPRRVSRPPVGDLGMGTARKRTGSYAEATRFEGDDMGQLTASYDAGTAGAPLVGDTIGVALAKMVVAQPDVEALVSRHQSVRLSYSELGAQVEQVARGLLAVGIETGDRVGIWAPNCVEWTLAAVRDARGSARSSSTSTRPTGRTSSRYALRHSGVRLLVTARSFKTSDYLAMLAGVRGELPDLEMVVTIDGESAGGAKRPRMARAGRARQRRSPPIRCAIESCSSTPTTPSTSSTRAARPATPRAPRSRTTTS